MQTFKKEFPSKCMRNFIKCLEKNNLGYLNANRVMKDKYSLIFVVIFKDEDKDIFKQFFLSLRFYFNNVSIKKNANHKIIYQTDAQCTRIY